MWIIMIIKQFKHGCPCEISLYLLTLDHVWNLNLFILEKCRLNRAKLIYILAKYTTDRVNRYYLVFKWIGENVWEISWSQKVCACVKCVFLIMKGSRLQFLFKIVKKLFGIGILNRYRTESCSFGINANYHDY